MKAVLLESHGPPEVLKYKDIPEIVCGPGKIKIKIKFSSINHLDLWVRSGLPGMHINLPMIMGSDATGTIVEIGKDVNGFSIGDDVVIQPGVYDPECKTSIIGHENLSPTYGILGETHTGVQSEFVVLEPLHVYQMPKSFSHAEISSMPLTFMTAYQMLIEKAKISKSDNLLIYGGTSGVGSAAIQIAKNFGCHEIISTVGSKDKIRYVEELGASAVFLHDHNLYSNVKNYLGQKKIDVVFEHIGKETWETSMKLLAKGGRLVTCGATTGSNVEINLTHIFFKQISILGSTMSNINAFKNVLKNISNKEYKPMIDSVFLAKDVVLAHQRIENRENMGKVVIEML